MNQKFFELPLEKQNRIINAGFKVFARNSYKKSPMNEIAAEAGISKALLFFYFKNKKEYYLYLVNQVVKITEVAMRDANIYELTDLFDMMYEGLRVKVAIMKKYPGLGTFSVKAYYETDEEVADEIQKYIAEYTELQTKAQIPRLNPGDFKEGLDLQMMFREMILASEGYIWEMQMKEGLDVDKMEKEFKELIEFWKKIYLK